MIRSVIFALFVSIALSSFGNAQSGVKLEDFKLTLKKSASNFSGKEFNFGQRVPGDSLVGLFAEFQLFDEKQDVEVTVAYPNVGEGKITVNYVEAHVIQGYDTADPKTEISSGGMNEQNVTVKLTAKGTKFFGYEVFVFGVLNP